jgi:hypothetical protein
LLALLRSFRAAGRRLTGPDDQLDLIDTLLIQQANAVGKPIVGSKMRVDPLILHRRHPRALFLMMLRDGRDILASRLHVGNFRQSAADVAREWSASLADFERFLQETDAMGQLVPYEALVGDPMTWLAQSSGHLGSNSIRTWLSSRGTTRRCSVILTGSCRRGSCRLAFRTPRSVGGSAS